MRPVGSSGVVRLTAAMYPCVAAVDLAAVEDGGGDAENEVDVACHVAIAIDCRPHAA
jgi:hypothetical protein